MELDSNKLTEKERHAFVEQARDCLASASHTLCGQVQRLHLPPRSLS